VYTTINGPIVVAVPPRDSRVSFGGFLLLIFGISWLGVAPGVVGSWLTADSSSMLRAVVSALGPLQLLMILGPALATVIVVGKNYGRSGLRALGSSLLKGRVALIWWAAVLLLPGIGVLVARGVAPAAATEALTLAEIISGVLPIFVGYLLVNTEELGWRGYALPQLQRRFSPLKANLLLTAIWIVFHLPLFLYKGGHPAGYGIAMFILMVFPIGMTMGYVFNATGGSLLMVHLLHQSINGWSEGARIFPVFTGSGRQVMVFVVITTMIGVAATVGLARQGVRGGAPARVRGHA
jgi:membrane protease YdiL (CAAX protease family)